MKEVKRHVNINQFCCCLW